VIAKLLIANRGEIAVRILRTCRDLKIDAVAVYSDVDADALHVRLADQSVHLPGATPTETYLNGRALIDAARASGAEAIHPGYGFLAESADFAADVAAAGLIWVGPPSEAIRTLGDKVAARRLASRVGVPIVPGLVDAVPSFEDVLAFGADHGYPLVVKAAAGGGGRGLKLVAREEDARDAFESAQREARSYFGSDHVYVERFLPDVKHIEIQILGISRGESLWIGARDCSLQRRHQKLIEEAPATAWADRSSEMGAAASRLASAAGYLNAGTVELLVEKNGDFYFLEVNSRLQVEHTVTEEVFGLDLVACQLRIACGEDIGLSQNGMTPSGHAIECRINAEDPSSFLPAPGRITRFEPPIGPGVRVDSGFAAGDEMSGHYDSLIAKVVTRGTDRMHALERMRRALSEFVIEGVPTTISLQLRLLEHPEFESGNHTTATVEALLDELPGASSAPEPVRSRLWNPAMAAAAPSSSASGSGRLVAPLQGTILEVRVRPGDPVGAGDVLMVLEAMKMETVLKAPFSGVVAEVAGEQGGSVGAGELLVVVEGDGASA
jgi:acetyl-CoA/propionyl-CoA carboxylase, biotin carboxylase, biotin carboxyl carrier protein